MRTVNIHAAKTHFSRLLDDVAAGEEIIIAKAGKPVAKLVAVTASPRLARQLGVMHGQFTVPDDFDTTFNDEIWGPPDSEDASTTGAETV